MDLAGLKDRLRAEVERRADRLVELSHEIHDHPETNYQERFAHDLLTSVLEEEGLAVDRSAFGVDTAFAATAGTSGPTIAVLLEYDALPGLGHACGHNIIATAGLGAGLAAAALAEEAGGRVVVLGTPAEEGGGGKILMAREGAFEGIDAAMMVHPAGDDLARMQVIAVQELIATYTGQAAHAAAFPHRGRNALDAAVLGYVNVAALRQHILPEERIHGVFLEGGQKPNIVPDRAVTEWMVRSPTIARLDPLKQRVAACLEAGTSAAACEVRIEWKSVVYADMLDNEAMVSLYAANAGALGRPVAEPAGDTAVVGSTDMGNVSYLVPSIHPMIAAAPSGLPIHTPDFATHAKSPSGDRAVVDGAVAMAWTVADLWLAEGALDAVRAEFRATVERVGPEAQRSAIAVVGGRVTYESRRPEDPPMTVYIAEEFTPDEADILRRYFTNLDGPVFALVNLPEVVKGALFARYSRSSKSLRRLFIDEFVGDLDITGDATIDATVGLRRAEELYDRVFFEYGDDSVAQLGGVHLACEQASNLLTKVLEWGRLMAYLEQSTRYIAYDARLGGRYRYYRDPEVLGSELGLRYIGDMDRLFDAYAELVPLMADFYRERFPKDPGDTDFVYRQAIRAKAFDAVRGVLPAASLSNVGIYGTGQGYEALLLRMRSHPLPEARAYADLMLTELRKVIPSFLKRVDLDDRGVAWSTYLATTRSAVEEIAQALFPDGGTPEPDEVGVQLLDWDPDGEVKLVAAMLYSHTHVSEAALEARVRTMTTEERLSVIRAYVGERANRRHKPGRALERLTYRFDVLADYGAFRDLQRHRMLSIEWQTLTPRHGFTRPEAVDLAGATERFDEAMERSAALHDALADRFPAQAPYAVSLAYKVRFYLHLNAREAMHLLELRTTPQGHPAYRVVGQQMHRLIADQAGHHAVAEAMRYVDHSPEPSLERLEAERRAETRRQTR